MLMFTLHATYISSLFVRQKYLTHAHHEMKRWKTSHAVNRTRTRVYIHLNQKPSLYTLLLPSVPFQHEAGLLSYT